MTSTTQSKQAPRAFLDLPDSMSPKSEIKDAIRELAAMEQTPEIKDHLEALRQDLKTATEEGGLKPIKF